jgi:ribose 5-phosphate isomerase B
VVGVRAGLVADIYSAHQGVEDDNMNVICIGARVVGLELALELVKSFLESHFSGHERHLRRLSKIRELEDLY